MSQKLLIKAAEYQAWRDDKARIAERQDKSRQVLAEAERLKMLAQEKGYQRGLDKARAEMVASQLEFDKRLQDIYREIESQVCELVLEATRKVIDGYDRPELIKNLVVKGLDMINESHTVVIRGNQQTLGMLKQRASKGAWSARVTFEEHPGFEADQLDMVSKAGSVRIDVNEVLKSIQGAVQAVEPEVSADA